MKKGFFDQTTKSDIVSTDVTTPSSAKAVKLVEAVPAFQPPIPDAETTACEDNDSCPMLEDMKDANERDSRTLQDDAVQGRASQSAQPAVDSPSTSGRPAGSLAECLALLRSNTDERKLVGLLLATRFISSEDLGAIQKVFHAVGFSFINRLFKTGLSNGHALGKGDGARRGPEDSGRPEYVHLALSITSAFCRVAELARHPEVVAAVPLFLRLIRLPAQHGPSGRAELAGGSSAELAGPKVDAYECLLATSMASQEGRQAALAADALRVVATDLGQSQTGAAWVPLAVRLLACLLASGGEAAKLAAGTADLAGTAELAATAELASATQAVSRELALRDDGVKLEALSLLLRLLAADESGPVRAFLRAQQEAGASGSWAESTRVGLGQLLHSRLGARERHLALQVARALIEICGDRWLIGPMGSNPDNPQQPLPSDRFFLVVVEMVRVEIHVLLNDVARLMLSPDNVESARPEQDPLPPLQRMLANCYALFEAAIQTLAMAASEGVALGHEMLSGTRDVQSATTDRSLLASATQHAALRAMDDTVNVILEFLTQARETGHTPHDDTLLASVRAVARYLADAPHAHRDKVSDSLAFMLSVTPALQHTGIHAVGFLLPALQQMADDPRGCDAIVQARGHRAIVALVRGLRDAVLTCKGGEGDVLGARDLVESACDVLLDVLASRDEERSASAGLRATDLADALPALLGWYRWSCTEKPNKSAAMDVDEHGLAGREAEAVEEHEAFVGRVVAVAVSILPLSAEKDLDGQEWVTEAGGLCEIFDMVVDYLTTAIGNRKGEGAGGEESRKLFFYDLVVASCAECVLAYPSLQRRLISSDWLQRECKGEALTPGVVERCTDNTNVKLLLATLAGI